MAIKKCPRCGKKFATDSVMFLICPNCEDKMHDELGVLRGRHYGAVMTSVCPICGQDKEPSELKEWWDEDKNENKMVRKFLKRSGIRHGLKRGTKICDDCHNQIDKLYYD